MKNWKTPSGDIYTLKANEIEWSKKAKFILNLCKNKDTVVQAGGNLGFFPYHLSKYFNEVITFEPVEKNLNCLYSNINGIDNITVHEYALGEKSGTVKIYKELPGNCGAIRLEYSNNIEDMPVNKLDNLTLHSMDLLWLDVEGFEVKALLGAEKVINKFKPVIVVENNGLMNEFPANLDGSEKFRNWLCEKFNYIYHNRIMRDDIFIYNE